MILTPSRHAAAAAALPATAIIRAAWALLQPPGRAAGHPDPATTTGVVNIYDPGGAIPSAASFLTAHGARKPWRLAGPGAGGTGITAGPGAR